MGRLLNVAAEARELAEEHLGKVVVNDVRVSDYVDWTGEDAYQVLIVVNKFDPKVLTPQARSAVAISLIRRLDAEGDVRYPFVSFVLKRRTRRTGQ